MGFGGVGSCGCHKQMSPFGGFSGQCYSSPGFGYPGFRGGSSFALIVVLFILLIIIGASLFGRY